MAVTEQTQLVNSGYGACKSCGYTSFTNTNGGVNTAPAGSCGQKYSGE